MDEDQVKQNIQTPKDTEQVKPIKFKVEPKAEPEIGLEKEKSLVNLLAKDEGLVSEFDMGRVSKFREISDKRENLYKIFDDMGKDIIISSALDMYAEDATEYGDNGKIIWAESDDTEVANTVNYLIETLRLDQSIWQYMYYLVKYGDLYLETFRETDLEDKIGKKNLLKNSNSKLLKEDIEKNKTKLEEGVIVNLYGENDRLQEYVELIPNPSEIFDLVKRGKTVGYLRTKVNDSTTTANANQSGLFSYQYNYNDNDIKLYDPTKFIHIYLQDTTSRTPETVRLFNIDDKVRDEEVTYTVRRGKSVLYDLYKIYREVKLLQDSILLNRLTKSSLVRILQIEVGEMGKQQAHQFLQRIKSLFEQKMSLNEGVGFSDYNNPGAMERNVYLQTRGGKGVVTPVTLGGDFNVGQLTDLDYFNNMLFAGLKIPKQFLGFTDDAAGFAGGESLMRISSRYSKTIKRFKNAMMQGIKTLINVFLLDRGLDTYVNNFTIKMQSPSTQEDKERTETQQNKLNVIQQTMSEIATAKDSGLDSLKILKAFLSEVITNTEALDQLQALIDEMENNPEESQEENVEGGDETSNDYSNFDDIDTPSSGFGSEGSSSSSSDDSDISVGPEGAGGDDVGDTLPNPSELGVDFTENE